MRKLCLFALFLVLMASVLYGCSAQSDGEMIKVSVSMSRGFGDVNQDFFVLSEDKSTINIFERVITKAVKQKGIVNMVTPDFDFEVMYSNGNKQGFHLWLGERGHKGTLMYVVDTHTIYTISEDMTNKLIDLLNAATQSADRGKPNILKMLGIQIHDEQYAGLYVDDGIYNINIVGEVDQFKDKAALDHVKFHSVNYSLKYLSEVAEVLTDNMLDLGISAIETNEKDNRVYVYIKGLDDNKRMKIKKVIDSPAIEAKEQHLELKFNWRNLNESKKNISDSGYRYIVYSYFNKSIEKRYMGC